MALLKRMINQAAVQKFMNDSVLMNWSNLNKTILVLVLGGLDHILCISWYLACYQSPKFQKWIDQDYYNFHITAMLICCVVSFSLVLVCHFLRHQKLAQNFLPYICLYFFAFAFIYGGYSIGIISPATIAGYISLVTVGLVLFERKIIYSVIFPATGVLVIAIFLCSFSVLPYAPVFSFELEKSMIYKNHFWVFSQMILYTPIFLISIILFEVLLTQWRNREKQIREISQIDPLTGVFNRRQIANVLAKMHKSDKQFAIVLLDLDHFKRINDSYGHDAGDEVLKCVARILSSNIREHDLVGRFGGEEFILILEDRELRDAIMIAERCRRQIEREKISIDQNSVIHVSASFGIAISDRHIQREFVLRQADRALYLAKENGRNQVRHYLDLTEITVEPSLQN